jgi:hypothetical protein
MALQRSNMLRFTEPVRRAMDLDEAVYINPVKR